MIILISIIFVTGLTAGEKTKSIIAVMGMKDKSCVEKITNSLADIDGVINVTVNLENNQVTIEHENADMVKINSAIVKAGYKTSHKNLERFHGVNTEDYNCSEEERAGCNKPCGKKQ
jgi:copper chaperone CopZ